MTRHPFLILAGVLLIAGMPLAWAQQPQAQGHITSPLEEFGHNFGDDYFLANYQQISTYWQKLARESKRIIVQPMGPVPSPAAARC